MICISLVLISLFSVQAAYSAHGPNVMYYWGQNSAGTQESLESYCESGLVDVMILSFLNQFGQGSGVGLDLDGACATASALRCPGVGQAIQQCQAKGVKVLLSLGGAVGNYGLGSVQAGQGLGDTLWAMFGPGKNGSSLRPFGTAVLDGIDLDIEGGASVGYVGLVNRLRERWGTAWVGAAPQCPFPDAVLGSVMDEVKMDYVNVQFYNNPCQLNSSTFNFNVWNAWAQKRQTKIMVTIPGSDKAAGSGYTPLSVLQPLLGQVKNSSQFGGVSVWDASQAWANPSFASGLYRLVHGNEGRKGKQN